MSSINLNDVTPAPPAKHTNVKFQSDASGNVSGYWPGGTWNEGFVPVITPVLPMVWVPGGTLCTYKVDSGTCSFSCSINGTLSGTATNQINISLPVPLAGSRSFTAAGFCNHTASNMLVSASISYALPNVAQVLLANAANFSLVGISLLFSIQYRCV